MAQNQENILQQVLDFTAADYEMNSQGFLSPRQTEKLDKALQKSMSDLRKMQIAFPIGAIFVIFILPNLFSSMPVRMELNIFTKGLIIFGAIVLPIVFEYLLARQKQLDPNTKDVIVPLDSFIYMKRGDNQNYTLTLLGKEMKSISADLFNALQNENVYRFYYSPYYDKIVSAKWYGHIKLQQVREQLETLIQQQRNLPKNIPALMAEAWDFTLTDIEANRRGKLTQHQLNQINKEVILVVNVNQADVMPDLDTPVEKVTGSYEPSYSSWGINLVEQSNLEIKIGNVSAITRSSSQRMGLLGLDKQTVYTMYYILDKRLARNRLVSIEAVLP